jgi:hypothetical protein
MLIRHWIESLIELGTAHEMAEHPLGVLGAVNWPEVITKIGGPTTSEDVLRSGDCGTKEWELISASLGDVALRRLIKGAAVAQTAILREGQACSVPPANGLNRAYQERVDSGEREEMRRWLSRYASGVYIE